MRNSICDNIKKSENEFIPEYNVLRVIACFLVVLGHATYVSMGANYGGVNYSSFFGDNYSKIVPVYNFFANVQIFIYRFHMPLFFALSGSLWYIDQQRKRKYTNFDLLVDKKFKRLIIPYFFAGILFMIPIKLISNYYNIGNVGYAIFNGLGIGTESGHLWFLTALFWCIVTFYFIEKYIMQYNKLLGFFVILFLYFFSDRLMISIPSFNPVFSYLLWYYFGYILESYREIIYKLDLKIKVLLIPLLYFFYRVCLKYVQIYDGKYEKYIDIFIKILLIIATYIIALLISKNNWILNSKAFNILHKYNFQIYLYHDPLNYLILFLFVFFGLRNTLYSSSLTILLLLLRTIGVIIISVLISKFISIINYKIKKIRLIGLIIIITILLSSFVSFNYYHPQSNTSNEETNINTTFMASKLTDNNWINGINNSENIILFDNTEFNKNQLKDAKAISFNNKVKKEIVSIKIVDNWIYVFLADRNDLQSFAYPNAIEVIK